MQLSRAVLTGLVLAMLPAAFAQRWEVGGGVGGGFYSSQTFTLPTGSADGGFSGGLAASVWVGQNYHASKLGGEIRYDYQQNSMKLSSGSDKATFGGQSHALHYDFLYHFAGQDAAIRPYISAGAGVKLYRGTGKEQAFQPLHQFALLTEADETTALGSVGAGAKFQLTDRISMRLEIKDNFTPLPKSLLTPNVGVKVGGWIHDFVPMVGITF